MLLELLVVMLELSGEEVSVLVEDAAVNADADTGDAGSSSLIR